MSASRIPKGIFAPKSVKIADFYRTCTASPRKWSRIGVLMSFLDEWNMKWLSPKSVFSKLFLFTDLRIVTLK